MYAYPFPYCHIAVPCAGLQPPVGALFSPPMKSPDNYLIRYEYCNPNEVITDTISNSGFRNLTGWEPLYCKWDETEKAYDFSINQDTITPPPSCNGW